MSIANLHVSPAFRLAVQFAAEVTNRFTALEAAHDEVTARRSLESSVVTVSHMAWIDECWTLRLLVISPTGQFAY